MLKKFEDGLSNFLVAILAIIPLLFKFIQGVLKVQIPGSDTAILHFVLLFACLAGIVTCRDERHLSLASFGDKLPEKVKKVVIAIREAATICVLATLFFASFCQFVNPQQFTQKFWGISIRVFFAFLPVCYLAMIVYESYKIVHPSNQSENSGKNEQNESPKKSLMWLSIVFGVIIAVLISQSSLADIFYYVFKAENLSLLYSISDKWMTFSQIACIPLVIIFIILAFMGLPLFLVLAGISYIALCAQGPGNIESIPIETYGIFTDRSIAAIPLFTIAGYILSQSNTCQRYVKVFNSLFGWFRGGTVVAAVIVTTFFSTFTGVSGITILALGPLLSVMLVGTGYSKDRAESLVASSGAIGLLFPPSAAIIMYATTNYFGLMEEEVEAIDLFKAAIIPGILMALSMIILGIIFDKQKERPKFSLHEIGTSILHCIPELLMPVFICIFYFGGVFDLFEVAAFAVIYAFVVTTFVRHDFTLKKSSEVIASSIPVSGGVLFILGAASGISFLILITNVSYYLNDFVTQFIHSKFLFLLLMNICLLIVGCLMDMFSAIMIVSPIFLLLGQSFGVPVAQSAVIFLMNLSIGFLTPPVGMDLFIASYAFEKPLSKVIKGILPFLIVQLVVLMLITYIPWFTTVLL